MLKEKETTSCTAVTSLLQALALVVVQHIDRGQSPADGASQKGLRIALNACAYCLYCSSSELNEERTLMCSVFSMCGRAMR
jgi:hypothetical protein